MKQPSVPLFGFRERLLLAVVGLALLGAAATLALRWEIGERERAFRLEAHNISLQLSRQLAEGRTMMVALHGFHRSGDPLQGAHLPHIAQNFTAAHPQARWVAYAEHVPAGAERVFEARMEEAGYMDLRIRPLRDGGGAAGAVTDHLALSLLEPLTPLLARLLGRDLLDHPHWRDVLREAVDTAEVRALRTEPLDFGASGFLLVRPTYRGNVEPADIDGRRRQLAGMLVLFIDSEALLNRVTASDPGLELALRRVDSAHAGERRLEEKVQVRGLGFGGETWPPRLTTELSLELAGTPVRYSLAARLAPRPTGPLAAALLTALLMTMAVHSVRQRRIALREERAGLAQAQLAEVTLHSIGEAVLRLDEDGRVRYVNPVAEAMAGVAAGDAHGREVACVLRLHGAGGALVTPTMLTDPAVLDGPLSLEMPDGSRHAVACTLSSLKDDSGRESGHVLVVRDVSREHELSRELAYQASHDPLTELPNRREFERRLATAIEAARAGDRLHALLYLDLDQFKLVNDTCGHAAGDQMLRQIAGLLSAEVRHGDVLARLGGDEFGVLLHGCDIGEATPIAERLCQVVADFRFTWGESVFGLGVSIGVVEIDAAAGTVDDLQRAADLACYAAKDTGRNRIHVYRQGDRIIARNHGEMQWHVEIKNALEDGRFVLHAQEIRRLHDVASPAVMHELLLRMVDADGELVPPMAFLPAAERYGLMAELDRMVVLRAMHHVAAAGRDNAVYTINLSGQSLADLGLAQFVIDAARRSGASPRRVCFEITETSAISNLNLAVQLMQRLRAEGFRFALDDFGAGLSSFGYLKQLPVDFLKIDGQFIREVDSDPVARAMVSSIINVARVLRLQTIAEKVETSTAQRCLRILGADFAQGWLIGRPQPIEDSRRLASSA